MTAADILKDHELPLKKQKLNDFLMMPYNLQQPTCIQQLYASLDPRYILQEYMPVNRHLSAFKPVVQSIKESKMRSAAALGRYPTDPPVLQNPERVVRMSESERFETSYQPNVALAPPTPKKHRYGRCNVKVEPTSPVKIEEAQSTGTPKEERENVIESTVSVVQSTATVPKYNPEIELSTDTEDSASETSEKHLDLGKVFFFDSFSIPLRFSTLFREYPKIFFGCQSLKLVITLTYLNLFTAMCQSAVGVNSLNSLMLCIL